MDRFSQMALSAARMAEADSGVSVADEPDRVGAAVATGIGGRSSRTASSCCSTVGRTAWGRSRSSRSFEHGSGLGVDGARHARPLSTQTTACAASNMAIGDGLTRSASGART